jgi:transcriptional regulator with PAS, ATPase and Fis domain
MSGNDWVQEFPGAVTVCDAAGRIIEMNGRSLESFAADGGAKLIGTNVLDCHPEPSRSKLEGMMAERRTNVYTIQKNGKKKLIYQAPWYKGGVYAGFVELAFDIPWDLPHFNRDSDGVKS